MSSEFGFLYRNIFLQPFSDFNFIFGWFFEFLIVEIKILRSKKLSSRNVNLKRMNVRRCRRFTINILNRSLRNKLNIRGKSFRFLQITTSTKCNVAHSRGSFYGFNRSGIDSACSMGQTFRARMSKVIKMTEKKNILTSSFLRFTFRFSAML